MDDATTATDRAAVLLSMGGPASSADVEPFMYNLFEDPRILPLPGFARTRLARFIVARRAERARERYRLLGGSSPIHGYTAQQVRSLGEALGSGWVVRHAFRYTAPRAREVVEELRDMGVTRAVALTTYPQRSFTTTDSSMEEFERAAHEAGIGVRTVTGYATDAGFVAALAGSLARTLGDAPPGTHVVMTAHSIPRRNVRRGDPYVAQVHQTARALARSLPAGVPWHLAFQSRVGPAGWVGPGVEEVIESLGRQGVGSVVVAPVSFTSEHLETMLELDHEVREVAANNGIGQYRRASVPGLASEFIEMLARLAQREVADG